MVFQPSTGFMYVTNQYSNVIIRVPPGGGTGQIVAGTPWVPVNSDGLAVGASSRDGYTGGGMWAPVAIVIDPSTGDLIVSTVGRKQTIRRIVLNQPASPFCDGKWHHMTTTYGGYLGDQTFKTYLDGSLYSSVPYLQTAATGFNSPYVPTTSAVTAIRIGWNGDNTVNNGDKFIGAVSDLRIYSQVLNQESIPFLTIPAVPSYDNAVVVPSLAARGVTSYTWSCLLGYTGPTVTIAYTAATNTWATTPAGAVVNCRPCPPGQYAPTGSAVCQVRV